MENILELEISRNPIQMPRLGGKYATHLLTRASISASLPIKLFW